MVLSSIFLVLQVLDYWLQASPQFLLPQMLTLYTSEVCCLTAAYHNTLTHMYLDYILIGTYNIDANPVHV